MRKNNDAHILRIKLICNELHQFIEGIENELLNSNTKDTSSTWRVPLLEGAKEESVKLCKKYVSHLEECTDDYIVVNSAIVDSVKRQAEEIKGKVLLSLKHETNSSRTMHIWGLPSTGQGNGTDYLL